MRMLRGLCLASFAEAALRTRVKQPLETAGVPGDVDAVQDPVEDILGAVSDDVVGAAAEIQGAAVGVGSQAAGNPNAVAGDLLSEAEGTFGDATLGRGLISDIIARRGGVQQGGRVGVVAAKEVAAVKAGVAATTFTTTQPAAFGGVYCRGAACQYRATTTKSPFVALGDDASEANPNENLLEFCRGLGCPRKRGWPSNLPMEKFTLNCEHLFGNYGDRRMGGNLFTRKAGDVKDSFIAACKERVGMLEEGQCSRYGDTFLAALAPKVKQKTVGDTKDICADTYDFVKTVKQAQIDLELITLPGFSTPTKGAVMLKQMGPRPAGPCSERGQAWHSWNLRKQRRNGPLFPTDLVHLPIYLQQTAEGGIPNCTGAMQPRPQAQTMYQILPGSADGQVPPVEVDGTTFMHCVDQITEITDGKPLPAPLTVAKAKEWCSWQGSSTHPEWNVQTCVGMAQMMAFAVRRDLGSTDPVSPQQVCKNLFLATGTVHRVEQIVSNSWKASTRGQKSTGPALPSTEEPDVKEWLDAAARRTQAVDKQIQAQQSADSAAAAAKEAVDSWQSEAEPVKTGPVFPDSAHFQPVSLTKLRGNA